MSDVGAETIRRAASVAPISDLQIEYSLLTRNIEGNGILAACRDLGIGITAYGVLGKGLLAGSTGGARTHVPRFQEGEPGAQSADHRTVGSGRLGEGDHAPQLAIAWVAEQGRDIVLAVGSRTVDQVRATLSSPEVALSADDLAAIGEVLSRSEVRGDRYPSAFMAQLDSER